MWTIHANARVTRRQSLSHVLDEDTRVLFSHKHLSECLSWCFEQGQRRVSVRCMQRRHPELILDIDKLPWPDDGP